MADPNATAGVKGQGGLLARLGALGAEAGAVLGSIEPALLTGAEAEAVLAQVTAVRNVVAGAMPALAARVAETGRWRQVQARSPGAHLGALTGGSASSGQRLADTGAKLGAAPGLAQAMAEGRVSPEQAEVVAEAVAETAGSARPEVAARASQLEAELLELAARSRAGPPARGGGPGPPGGPRRRRHPPGPAPQPPPAPAPLRRRLGGGQLQAARGGGGGGLGGVGPPERPPLR